MNKDRRKGIAKAQTLIDEAKAILESAQSDEQDYYDNMPENMQSGDKGQKAGSRADALQEAVDACDEVISNIERATE